MIVYNEKQLIREVKIVWKENPLDFPYLREGVAIHTKSKGPIAYRGRGRLIGYAELDGPNGEGIYFRRFWWFADHDPYNEFTQGNIDWHPAEAVDPEYIIKRQQSISPGEAGQE